MRTKMVLGFWAAVIAAVCCSASFSYALPEGEQVAAGSAVFDRSAPDTLNVATPSKKLIVNYDSFNIANHEAVNFHQPSVDSVVLNREAAEEQADRYEGDPWDELIMAWAASRESVSIADVLSVCL